MLSSRVKISCFGSKSHLVFHWCLYNKVTICLLLRSKGLSLKNDHTQIHDKYNVRVRVNKNSSPSVSFFQLKREEN